MASAGVMIILVINLFVRFLVIIRSMLKRRAAPHHKSFPARRRVRLAARIGGPLMLLASYVGIQLQVTLLADILIAGIGIVIQLAEPGEIWLDDRGAHQIAALGWPRRRFDWHGARARYTSGHISVVVGNEKGPVITHTRYHERQLEFVRELLVHQVPFNDSANS